MCKFRKKLRRLKVKKKQGGRHKSGQCPAAAHSGQWRPLADALAEVKKGGSQYNLVK
jgi:hypothetical protein